MKIDEALMLWLYDEYEYIAITRQALYLAFLEIWTTKQYQHEKVIGISSSYDPRRKFYQVIKKYILFNYLLGVNESTKGHSFFIKTKFVEFNQEAEKIISAIYPFGYLSHLTAMNIYGITQLRSSGIYFTCPSRSQWKELCLTEIKNKFNFKVEEPPKIYQHLELDFPDKYSLNDTYVSLNSIIISYPTESILDELTFSKSLIILNKSALSEPEWWAGYRVQNLLDLYLEMVRAPQYCGGLSHVVKVYKSSIDEETFLQILDYVEDQGTLIDKARLGFIFDRILSKVHPILDKWKSIQENKKGGSRKLVATSKFEPEFDPEWNISINHEEFKRYLD